MKNTMKLIMENQFNYLIKLGWHLIFQSNDVNQWKWRKWKENNKSESENSENENKSYTHLTLPIQSPKLVPRTKEKN